MKKILLVLIISVLSLASCTTTGDDSNLEPSYRIELLDENNFVTETWYSDSEPYWSSSGGTQFTDIVSGKLIIILKSSVIITEL